jgi:molybdate transport repressor ModE-like protein/molybdopterin-binding protein
MVNRYEVTVESCDRAGTTAWLKLGRGRLAARSWEGIRPGQALAVRVPPEDVILCSEHPGRVSARNVLPGHVRSVKLVPQGALVTLDVGFPLASLVTRSAVRELGVRRGARLFALVKAVAVLPEVRVQARFRVAVEAPSGRIDVDQLDLLRAIGRTGSISAAAKERSISFRTAWDWVESIHRRWGRTLVARTQGGRGGGGATLTPEARALLREAARRESSS